VDLTKKRIREPVIFKEHPDRHIKRMTVPGPDKYRAMEAWKATQLSKRGSSIASGSRQTMLCNFKRNTSFV
jgi:hypothetical protein